MSAAELNRQHLNMRTSIAANKSIAIVTIVYSTHLQNNLFKLSIHTNYFYVNSMHVDSVL